MHSIKQLSFCCSSRPRRCRDPTSSDAPTAGSIANSVTVPAGSDIVYLSGMLADAADTSAPAGSIERFGDTAAQTKSVLGKIARELESVGLTMADVVKMNVFLVGDPRKGGGMDFEGLMRLSAALVRHRRRTCQPARRCRWLDSRFRALVRSK
jgi:enamine deaminase RidA (YjgF/YER057c/UK114 family)